MTEAGWTRERPTKNGWYWWRFDASTSATIVRIMVCGDGSLAEMSNNGHLLLAANFDGEWLGPIAPTDYQQGRVAACEWKYDDMDDYYETACKNAYCLADGTLKDNEHKYCPYCGGLIQLAQAAQAAQAEKPTKEGL